MTIGEVARESGIAASAIRYYEQEGVLPKPPRTGGRRIYDRSILDRLALVERAKAVGFTLADTRHLLQGFGNGRPPSERWRPLAIRKIAELDELSAKIKQMRDLLDGVCNCRDLSECGRRLATKRRAGAF